MATVYLAYDLKHDRKVALKVLKPELAASKTGANRLTETGMSLGTPACMSPEQAMSERTLDARTDIYALGCVLYEMLVGEPPFTGPTAQAIVARVMTEEPPVRHSEVAKVRPRERATHTSYDVRAAPFPAKCAGGTSAARSSCPNAPLSERGRTDD